MSQPNTALIVLGDAMFFNPETTEVLAVTITAKENLATSLQQAETASLETLHLVVKSADITRLYDSDAIASLVPALQPNAEVTVHVLNPGGQPEEDVIATVRTSLVLGGLRLEVEQAGPDGSWIITARRPGDTSSDDDDES